jgi:hypothetical protein
MHVEHRAKSSRTTQLPVAILPLISAPVKEDPLKLKRKCDSPCMRPVSAARLRQTPGGSGLSQTLPTILQQHICRFLTLRGLICVNRVSKKLRAITITLIQERLRQVPYLVVLNFRVRHGKPLAGVGQVSIGSGFRVLDTLPRMRNTEPCRIIQFGYVNTPDIKQLGRDSFCSIDLCKLFGFTRLARSDTALDSLEVPVRVGQLDPPFLPITLDSLQDTESYDYERCEMELELDELF